MDGHSARQISDTSVTFLHEVGIETKYCIGQSYDSASNMSGKYNSVQKIILDLNPFAVYISCFGHSLNLVGTEP